MDPVGLCPFARMLVGVAGSGGGPARGSVTVSDQSVLSDRTCRLKVMSPVSHWPTPVPVVMDCAML